MPLYQQSKLQSIINAAGCCLYYICREREALDALVTENALRGNSRHVGRSREEGGLILCIKDRVAGCTCLTLDWQKKEIVYLVLAGWA